MPRTRQIHPGFFKNEDLHALGPLHALFFEGLWCWADRCGRLEDRPRRLKAEILPYYEADGEKLMADLAAAGFVQRYEANGQRLVVVVNFERHQRVHPSEVDSNLPVPTDTCISVNLGSPDGAPSVNLGSPSGVGNPPLSSSSSFPSRSSRPSCELLVTTPERPSVLTLKPTPAEKPKKKVSRWEILREDLRARRAKAIPGVLPDVELKSSGLAKALGTVQTGLAAPEVGGVTLEVAYEAFLADPYARERDPPCPLPLFVSQWAKYASAAKRGINLPAANGMRVGNHYVAADDKKWEGKTGGVRDV